MEITDELITTIYSRVREYAFAKYGTSPDEVIIEEDGNIVARYISYYCGDRDVDEKYISAGNLTEDLDEVGRQRVIDEAARKVREEERRKTEALQRQAAEKERRRQEYLKLQREFGN